MAMIAGTIYGAALNDRDQCANLAAAFESPPHNRPPQRPILYIKPRNCLMGDAGMIPLPAEWSSIAVAPTLGLLIGRDISRVPSHAALDQISGICLALDIGEPDAGFYRPPVRQNCRDGFLRLGALAEFVPSMLDRALEAQVNGALAHSWSPRRLVRDVATLIAEISTFMTLAAGDLLLIGVPHDAPRLRDGDRITLSAKDLPLLSATVRKEAIA